MCIDQTPSSWTDVAGGVPQGSVLGPLLYLIYTSDLPAATNDIASVTCNQFADDTGLQSAHTNVRQATANLQQAVDLTGKWLTDWHLLANTEKTKIVEFQRRPLPLHADPPITLYRKPLATVSQHRHLGLILSSDLRWTPHVDVILSKASRLLGVLRRLSSSLSQAALSAFYMIYIRPILEYANVVWGKLPTYLDDRIERLQRKAARIVPCLSLYAPVNHTALLTKLNWPTLSSRRTLQQALLAFRLHRKLIPQHLQNVSFSTRTVSYNLRRPATFHQPHPRTHFFRDSPLFFSTSVFHSLPASAKYAKTLSSFKATASELLLSNKCSCSTCNPH